MHAPHQHTTAPGTAAATGGPQGQSLPAAQSRPPLPRCAGWRLRREVGGRANAVEQHVQPRVTGVAQKTECNTTTVALLPALAGPPRHPSSSDATVCKSSPLRTGELGAGPVPSGDHPVQHHLKHTRQPASVEWNKNTNSAAGVSI